MRSPRPVGNLRTASELPEVGPAAIATSQADRSGFSTGQPCGGGGVVGRVLSSRAVRANYGTEGIDMGSD